MAHGLVERMRARQALDAADEVALDAGGRPEQALHQAEPVHRQAEQVVRDHFAVHVQGQVGVHLRHGAEHRFACVQDLARGVERGHGVAALGEQHHLVELAFDDAVHFAAVVARQARLACVAQRVLVAVHQRVHGGIERIVAEEPQRIGAPERLLLGVQDAEGVLQRRQQLGGLSAVHGVAQLVVRRGAEVGHRIEQRVGALVSQQERVGFVARSADGLEQRVVHVASEEIMGDDCWHSVSPFLVWLTFILRGRL